MLVTKVTELEEKVKPKSNQSGSGFQFETEYKVYPSEKNNARALQILVVIIPMQKRPLKFP